MRRFVVYTAQETKHHQWVVSRSLKSVGPNATLVEDDIEAVIRRLKAQLVGEIEVAGPDLAGSLTTLGLIDEYRLYFRPIVLGRGKPFFAGPRPPAPGRRSALRPAISLAR
jgi:dihydrofolate reductase